MRSENELAATVFSPFRNLLDRFAFHRRHEPQCRRHFLYRVGSNEGDRGLVQDRICAQRPDRFIKHPQTTGRGGVFHYEKRALAMPKRYGEKQRTKKSFHIQSHPKIGGGGGFRL